MIDEIRLAYAALATHGAVGQNGLITLPLPSANGAYVGLDEQSHQHLLLETDVETEVNPEVTTLTVTNRHLNIEGREHLFLDVACLFGALSEVFDHFSAAVLQRMLTTSDSPATAVAGVLSGWRSFLTPPSGPPSLDKVSSVLGELLVVRDAVQQSGVVDISFWTGPFGHRHDMRSKTTALEVKTTRSHTGYRVTIHGEDQLLPPEGVHLYLHLVRLESVHQGAVRLPALVDELLEVGVMAERLFQALAASGIGAADLPATDSTAFEVRERVTVAVTDQTPRIVPGSFVDGQRPSGVVDIAYVIDLEGILDSAVGDAQYRELTRSLATGVAS
ncbi:MAG: PD-(D/E)XK motif protein [Mycobacterium sp.]